MGRVTRPHGLHGEVVVALVSNRAERSQSGARYRTDHGELVVEDMRPLGQRWLVRFAGVRTREAADALRGTVLQATALPDADALWVHEMVGSVVERGDGTVLGRVVSVVANPASDLLELDTGGLVPTRFVVDHHPGRVVVEGPEGLGE